MTQPIPLATVVISVDEKCHMLSELNENRPGGWRRIQSTYVLRDGAFYVYQRDLGPAADFTKEEFRIVSLGEDPVGRVWEMADYDRLEDNYWQRFVMEQAAASTLQRDAIAFFEERYEVARNRSVFGPEHRKERNAFIRPEKARKALAHTS